MMLAASAAFAQQIPVDLPLFDSDNFPRGFRGPSMAQSVAATAAFYEESHRAIERAFRNHERYARSTVAIFDAISAGVVPLPLSDVWLHEEFHRAVLASRGVRSFDDVYHFKLLPEVIAVSRVRDEVLARLKREHPADLVRAHEAGIEGEHQLVEHLEKEHFFRGSTAWHLPLYWLVKVSSAAYVVSGTSDRMNRWTERWERKEGSNVRRRDFTGHDFIAWVYDLSRPVEPYEARGIHPSGIGIRRYRRPSDLTPDERLFLRRQGRRALLNFLDSNLVDVDRFKIGSTTLNLTSGHLLTSFGYTTTASLFICHDDTRLFVILHRYVNRDRSFPGIDVEMIDRRFALRAHDLATTLRIALWLQPRGQQFRTNEATPGLLASVRLREQRMFVEIEAKSAGWVAGNVHLDRSVAVRGGITIR